MSHSHSHSHHSPSVPAPTGYWRNEACSAKTDLVTEYLNTYLEWRETYGLADSCMEELLGAVLAEFERGHPPAVHAELQSLVYMIKTQVHEAREQRDVSALA